MNPCKTAQPFNADGNVQQFVAVVARKSPPPEPAITPCKDKTYGFRFVNESLVALFVCIFLYTCFYKNEKFWIEARNFLDF